jgi:hypothetical protein
VEELAAARATIEEQTAALEAAEARSDELRVAAAAAEAEAEATRQEAEQAVVRAVAAEAAAAAATATAVRLGYLPCEGHLGHLGIRVEGP